MKINRWQVSGLLVLYVAVIALSVKVVTNRHQARQLFVQVQQLEKERDQLGATWSRLVLEQSTQLNQVHVESRARDALGMRKPTAESIKVIRE
jgi:cell division protein FtsL